MKVNKRLLVMLACCLFIICSSYNGAASAASSLPFKDVSDKHWARTAIAWGYEQGIVKGDQNNNFSPEAKVTEAEFLAMVVRAYNNELSVRDTVKGEKWYRPYFDMATDKQWYIYGYNVTSQRYHVANLIYSMLKGSYRSDETSIQYLLDTGLSSGKNGSTVAGYLPYDHLTRAEAIVFVQRLKKSVPSLLSASHETVAKGLRDITIGAAESELVKLLGQPDRKDASKYSYTWYVYNKNPNSFAMYGISSEKKVVALYSNARNVWGADQPVKVGSSFTALGKHVANAAKLNVYDYVPYEANGIIINYYLDNFAEQSVDSILMYAKDKIGAANSNTAAVDSGYDRQIFDFTNVLRHKNALRSQLKWSDKAAKSAYGHSKDMYTNNYMDHTNLRGQTPQDRMAAAGLTNFGGGENIAFGYEDSFEVYLGWLNSKGHRDNMLYEQYQLLGVGSYRNYYTQNFVLPY